MFVLRELIVGLFKFRIWICVRALAFMFVFLKDVSVTCTYCRSFTKMIHDAIEFIYQIIITLAVSVLLGLFRNENTRN